MIDRKNPRRPVVARGLLALLLLAALVPALQAHRPAGSRNERREARILDQRSISEPDDFALLEHNEVAVPLHFGEVSTSNGRLEVSVHVDTGESGDHLFETLSFGVASFSRGQIEVESVAAGAGLLAYAAQNGEPPECDIVIYPGRQDPVGSITKLFAGVPFDSIIHGTEFLRVTYSIAAEPPRAEEPAQDDRMPSTSSFAEDARVSRARLELFTEEDMEWDPRANAFRIEPSRRHVSMVVALDEIEGSRLVPGDVNEDSILALDDAIAMIGFLFRDATLDCEAAADVNRDDDINLSDPIFLLGALYLGTTSIDAVCELDATSTTTICASEACID